MVASEVARCVLQLYVLVNEAATKLRCCEDTMEDMLAGFDDNAVDIYETYRSSLSTIPHNPEMCSLMKGEAAVSDPVTIGVMVYCLVMG